MSVENVEGSSSKRKWTEANSVDDVPKKIIPHKRQRYEQVFPEDIEHEILLRLPARSLTKFTGVCKSWRCLIRNRKFIHAHLYRSIIQPNSQNDGDKLLIHGSDKRDGTPNSTSEYFNLTKLLFVAYVEVNRPSTSTAPLPQPQGDNKTMDSDVKRRCCELVGICNGLVCLLIDKTRILLWNPWIRKFVILPPPSVTLKSNKDSKVRRSEAYAFGFDLCNNDYKVLRTVSYSTITRLSCKFEIWSLARGSWKSLRGPVIPRDFSPGIFTYDEFHAFVNGALHWIHRDSFDEKLIVSFDMSTELFGKIAMPKAVLRRPTSCTPEPQMLKQICHVSSYKESLAFFEKHESMGPDIFVRYDMWVMKEYGVAESWAKILTISRESELVHRPLVFRRRGEVVLESSSVFDGSLRYHSMDPDTKQSNDFQVNGFRAYHFMESVVESLVLLDQPNAISY